MEHTQQRGGHDGEGRQASSAPPGSHHGDVNEEHGHRWQQMQLLHLPLGRKPNLLAGYSIALDVPKSSCNPNSKPLQIPGTILAPVEMVMRLIVVARRASAAALHLRAAVLLLTTQTH